MQQPLAYVLETMSHLSPLVDVMLMKVFCLMYLEVDFICTHGTGRQKLKFAPLPLHKNECEKSILEMKL